MATDSAARVTITPATAEDMLTHNDRNRALSGRVVDSYARQMSEGKWLYTGTAIIFSNDGRLIDGQHRLAACVKSGCSFECLVVFGAPDEAFAFIDIGKKRGPADIFSIHGVKNYTLMAAATSWVIGYTENRVASGARNALDLQPEELYQKYLEHERLQESAWVCSLFKQNKLAPASMMVALHYLFAKKHRGAADQFMEKVGDGVGLKRGDPEYKLRNKLVENSQSVSKLPFKVLAAMTIKAWNSSRTGRPLGVLRQTSIEKFPRIV